MTDWDGELVEYVPDEITTFSSVEDHAVVTLLSLQNFWLAGFNHYFWVLPTCFRDDKVQFWFLLGTIHGVAFQCKAITLPWKRAVIVCERPA